MGTVPSGPAVTEEAAAIVKTEPEPEETAPRPAATPDAPAAPNYGMFSGHAKLTDERVMAVLHAFAVDGVIPDTVERSMLSAMAREYQVNPRTLELVLIGDTWRHIAPEIVRRSGLRFYSNNRRVGALPDIAPAAAATDAAATEEAPQGRMTVEVVALPFLDGAEVEIEGDQGQGAGETLDDEEDERQPIPEPTIPLITYFAPARGAGGTRSVPAGSPAGTTEESLLAPVLAPLSVSVPAPVLRLLLEPWGIAVGDFAHLLTLRLRPRTEAGWRSLIAAYRDAEGVTGEQGQ